ncbi:unnamed protein product [Mucor hiemalis]
MKVDKQHHTNRPVPCPYKKQQLESNHPEKLTQPQSFGYSQACALLQAIELNRRKRLDKKCLAHLALYVSQAWEEKPCTEKIQQLYYMMNNLLDTTNMDVNEPFEIALQKYCQSPVSTPTICPSVTLLVAISYVERLNKRYRNLKGTAGCGSRMIMVAFIMASKYIHESLKKIIYTGGQRLKPAIQNNSKSLNSTESLITPPTSPKIPVTSQVIQNITEVLEKSTDTKEIPNTTTTTTPTTTPPPTEVNHQERNQRIARMEQEFLFFLNYDLSVQDPSLLVKWAQSYQIPEKKEETEEEYTSADEGDDEMDDEDE